MRILFFILILNIPLISLAQVPVAHKSLSGSYLAQTYEKDTILNTIVPVYHKLTLKPDSTFSFVKQSENGHCNTNRAGYWNSKNGVINLEFIGEEPLALNINEGPNYLTLVNKPEKLTLFKQQPRIYEGDQMQRKKSSGKKSKEPPCPTF